MSTKEERRRAEAEHRELNPIHAVRWTYGDYWACVDCGSQWDPGTDQLLIPEDW